MNQREKNLNHAMLSFALLGGLLVAPSRHRQQREESRPPQDFVTLPPRQR